MTDSILDFGVFFDAKSQVHKDIEDFIHHLKNGFIITKIPANTLMSQKRRILYCDQAGQTLNWRAPHPPDYPSMTEYVKDVGDYTPSESKNKVPIPLTSLTSVKYSKSKMEEDNEFFMRLVFEDSHRPTLDIKLRNKEDWEYCMSGFELVSKNHHVKQAESRALEVAAKFIAEKDNAKGKLLKMLSSGKLKKEKASKMQAPKRSGAPGIKIEETAHRDELDDIFKRLQTSKTGLSDTRATELLSKWGPNRMTLAKRGPKPSTDAPWVTALQTCTVVRDGVPSSVMIENIVPGDVIFVLEDMPIPADARVLATLDAKSTMDKVALTGEAMPTPISNACTDWDMLETQNMIFKGCKLLEGGVAALVINTGDNTILGKVASHILPLNESNKRNSNKAMIKDLEGLAICKTYNESIFDVIPNLTSVLIPSELMPTKPEILRTGVSVKLKAMPKSFAETLAEVKALVAQGEIVACLGYSSKHLMPAIREGMPINFILGCGGVNLRSNDVVLGPGKGALCVLNIIKLFGGK